MVPSGWTAIKEDVRTWYQVTGAASAAGKLRVLLGSPALWALAFYRWGRWIFAETRGHRPVRRLSRILHALLRNHVARLTRVNLPVQARIGRDVWIGSHDTTRVNPFAEVGDGVRLFGGNTLGVGGRGANRGAPKVGSRVTFGPGAVAVGPVRLADGVTLGANACAVRTLDAPGLYLGVPAKPAPTLVPNVPPRLEDPR